MGICLIVKSGGGIDTSNANATASTIVSGYTCYVNDVLITGTMPKQSLAKEFGPGGSQTISAGYYDGNSSKISVSTLSSVTGGTSVATSDVLTGYTYWSSGSKYTGSMVSRGTKAWTIGANGSQTIESGWHNGSGTVKQSLSTDSSESWITPTTSQKQLCWSGYYYSKNRGCYGNGNLTAGNIKKGISIFGVSGSYYTTKRYIIQNGALTGLLSSDILTAVNWYNTSTDNKSYNGSTWAFLSAYATSWDEDSGTWMNTLIYRRFKNANSLVAFSKSSWPCRFHADILTDHTWNGTSTTNGRINLLPRWIKDSDGKTWRGDIYYSWTYPYQPWDYSGYLSISKGQTYPHGVVTVNTSRLNNTNLWGSASVAFEGSYLKGKVGNYDLVFDSVSHFCDGGKMLWCKDLWIETTETTP